jgi:hypothetical protein
MGRGGGRGKADLLKKVEVEEISVEALRMAVRNLGRMPRPPRLHLHLMNLSTNHNFIFFRIIFFFIFVFLPRQM